MKCPFCGYVSLDHLARCKQCDAELSPLAPPRLDPEPLDAGLPEELFSLRLEPGRNCRAPEADGMHYEGLSLSPDQAPPPLRSEIDLERLEELVAEVEGSIGESLADQQRPAEADPGPDFILDESLIPPALPGLENEEIDERDDERDQPRAHDPPAMFEPQTLRLDRDLRDPIIDRDEEVPERFWTPEGAGMGRRVAALAVDCSLLAAALGLFFGGASLSLRASGIEPSLLLTPPGLSAVIPPFSLLAILLGLSYFTFFHGWIGRTPGKGVAGIEVRTIDGSDLSYGRAFQRSLGGLASFACAGVGLVWAIFEPRRRGWADLCSRTVLGECARRS